MNQSVYAIVNFNESAEFGNILDFTFNNVAFLESFTDDFPRIFLNLFQTESQLLVFSADFQNNRF